MSPVNRAIASLSLGACLPLFATLASPALASAQSNTARPPDECGFNETTVSYGPLAVGSVVTLQRHRFMRGEDNWDHAMAPFLGREARVTRLSGVDGQGCAGVRVDLDGGTHFWRARDLGVGTSTERIGGAAITEGFPQDCHQSEANVSYGAATVGTTVVLGRHRAFDGETNWAETMEPYVGRRARIVGPASIDNVGCPGVRVDIDGGEWFWRVRDLRPATSEVSITSAAAYASQSLAEDHGRPELSGLGGGDGLFGVGGVPGPQACGLSDSAVPWGSMHVGAEVRLGRHRAVAGDENWDEGMEPLLGSTASVTELIGVDDQGCAVVHVDADQGRFFWRARDLVVLVPPVPADRALPSACGLRAPDFGPLAVGSRVTLGQHTPYSGASAQGGPVAGDTNWVEEMAQFVGRSAVVTRLDGIDAAGCTVIRVDADSGQFAWRVRDAQRAD